MDELKIKTNFNEINIINLLKFKEILIPNFQRKYNWGGKKKNELNGLEYFQDFLCKKKYRDSFGTLLVYKKNFGLKINGKLVEQDIVATINNEQFNELNNIIVYLADGQHRIITIIISLFATLNYLKNNNIMTKKFYKLSNSTISKLLNYNSLNVLKTPNIEVMLNNNQDATSKENIINVIREADEVIKQYGIDNIQLLKKKLKSSPCKYTYLLIYQLLDELYKQDDDMEEFNDLYSTFFNRIEGGNLFGLTILQPGNLDSEKLVDLEAISEFNERNGMSVSLTEGEIFSSHILRSTTDNDKIRDYLFKKHSHLLSKYKIDTTDDLVIFLQKGLTSDWSVKPDVFVYELLKNENQDTTEFINLLEALEKIEKLFQKEDDWTKLIFDIYCVDFMTPRIAAYIAKSYIEGIKTNSFSTKKLIRSLVLFSVYSSFWEKGTRRPNLSRDLQDCKTIDKGVKFVANHLHKSTTINDFKNQLEKHISTHDFGSEDWRKLGKLILLLSQNTGKQQTISLSDYKKSHYEHLFPQNWKEEGPSFPRIQLDLCQQIVGDENLINMIGNGALLNGKTNSSLSNLSPYSKYKSANLNTTKSSFKLNFFSSLEELIITDLNGDLIITYKYDNYSKQRIIDNSNYIARNVSAWIVNGLVL